MKVIGQLLRSVREARGLGREEVARQLGYRDIRKGVRRLQFVEATGHIKEDLLVRLLEVLGIDWADFDEARSRLQPPEDAAGG